MSNDSDNQIIQNELMSNKSSSAASWLAPIDYKHVEDDYYCKLFDCKLALLLKQELLVIVFTVT